MHIIFTILKFITLLRLHRLNQRSLHSIFKWIIATLHTCQSKRINAVFFLASGFFNFLLRGISVDLIYIVFIKCFEKVVIITLFAITAWIKLILVKSYIHHFRWNLLTSCFICTGMNGIFILIVNLKWISLSYDNI